MLRDAHNDCDIFRKKGLPCFVQFRKLRGATTILHKEVGVSKEVFLSKARTEKVDNVVSVCLLSFVCTSIIKKLFAFFRILFIQLLASVKQKL